MRVVVRSCAHGLIVGLLLTVAVSASPSPPRQPSAKTSADDREALLRDIAKAWAGTPYRNAGTTFSGIGNAEFVREVYGAVFDADLPGDPQRWTTMGVPVAREKLEPGDIVFYDADPLTHFKKAFHAGVYIGDGQFVASVRSATVSVGKLSDSRWKAVYQTARRIVPAAMAPSSRSTLKPVDTTRPVSDPERRLRDVEGDWHGTPYRLGGTSKSGIDCSAFSRMVYAEVYRVELPRTVEEQEAVGKSVARSRLRPGDLVFFRTQGMGPRSGSRHVGVYLGGGEFAQASGSRGVTVSRLDDPYWNERYKTARRVG